MDTATKEYVERVVASCPPLTPAQKDLIASLMHGIRISPECVDSPERIKAVQNLRNAEEVLASARQAMQDEMVGCQGCGLTEKVHGYQKNHGLGYHDFVPMTPDETIHVIELHKPKLAAAELAVASAKRDIEEED